MSNKRKDCDSQNQIAALIETNRELAKQKKVTNLQKLQSYHTKIGKIKTLLESCPESEKQYLVDKMEVLKEKSGRIEANMHKIEQIESEIQKYKEKQNCKRVPNQSSFVNTLFQFLGVVFQDIAFDEERHKIKIRTSNSHLMQELEVLLSKYTRMYESRRQHYDQSLLDHPNYTQIITTVNNMLQCFQIQYHIQQVDEINEALRLINEEYTNRKGQQQRLTGQLQQQVEELRDDKDKLESQIELKRNELYDLKKEIDCCTNKFRQSSRAVQKHIEGSKRELEELLRSIKSKQELIKEEDVKLRKLKEKEKKYNQKMIDVEYSCKRLDAENHKLEEQLAERHEGLKELNIVIQQVEAELAQKELECEQLALESQQRHEELKKIQELAELVSNQILGKQKQKKELMEELLKLEESNKNKLKQQNQMLTNEANLQTKYNNIKGDYDRMLEAISKLKEEEAKKLQNLLDIKHSVQEQNLRNDRLIKQHEQLESTVTQKFEQISQLESELQEYKKHKRSMEKEFESIEKQKEVIFAAVIQKEELTKSLEQKKYSLEERVNKLENEGHKYQKIFNEYNTKIEAMTCRILELSDRQKSLQNQVQQWQLEEAQTLKRVKQLQRLQAKLCVKVGRDTTSGSQKSRVQELLRKLERTEDVQKSVQQDRKGRPEVQNVRNVIK